MTDSERLNELILILAQMLQAGHAYSTALKAVSKAAEEKIAAQGQAAIADEYLILSHRLDQLFLVWEASLERGAAVLALVTAGPQVGPQTEPVRYDN